MVVAPGTGLNDYAILAERLRRMIEISQINWGQQILSVTVSIGLATWSMARVSLPDELITSADKALYTAKEAGRNRVAAFMDEKIVLASSLDLPNSPKESSLKD